MTDTLAQARQKLDDGVMGIINLIGAAIPTKVVTVQAGDTLSGLAKRELGDARKWPEIFFLNLDVIKQNQAKHPPKASGDAFSQGFSPGFGAALSVATTTIYAGQQLLVMTI